MPTCFVAMPITTSEPSLYHGDAEHFRHVLDHLFSPALEKAGFEAISPIAQGADVIHAEIIAKLETADLVLCDVSSLNANVFFELGIRTALNRPICIVKDDLTARIPFDTTLINHYTYQSALQPWSLSTQIASLAEHIRVTAERSAGANALWKHFGLSIPGKAAEASTDSDSKLTLLAQQVQALSQRLGDTLAPFLELASPQSKHDHEVKAVSQMQSLLALTGIMSNAASWSDGRMQLTVDRLPKDPIKSRLAAMSEDLGYTLSYQLRPKIHPPTGSGEAAPTA